MRPFTILTSLFFKVEIDGQRVFLPWWVFGQRYQVSDKEAERKIRRYLTMCHAVSLVTILALGAYLGFWLALLVPFPFFFVLVQSKAIELTRRL
jgi:fatty acid desaturase